MATLVKILIGIIVGVFFLYVLSASWTSYGAFGVLMALIVIIFIICQAAQPD